jgi:peptide/nickel transport system ATP-binding protein
VLAGEPPSPARPPAGCRFHPRCPIAEARCSVDSPELVASAGGRRVACHFPGRLAPAGKARDMEPFDRNDVMRKDAGDGATQ